MKHSSLFFVGLAILGLAGWLCAQPGPENFAVKIGSAEVCKIDPAAVEQVNIDVLLDFDVAGVQGFSVGVCTGDESVAVPSAVEETDDLLTAKNGEPADFRKLNVVPGGVTIGVVVDFGMTGTMYKLPVTQDFHAMKITYDVVGEPTVDCPDGDLSTTLDLCDTLGDPVVVSVAVVEGDSIAFESPKNQNGEIKVGTAPPPECDRFAVLVDDITLSVGGTTDANVVLNFQHGLGTPECDAAPDVLDYAIQGWSFGICNDPAAVRAIAANWEVTDTGTVKDGEMPDFRSVNIYDEGVTMGVVIDFGMTGTMYQMPARNDFLALIVTYEPAEGALDCPDPLPDPAPSLSTELTVCDTLGDPVIATVMVVGGNSIPPDVTKSGAATIICRPPLPQFTRGDANQDRRVDLADGIWILNELFQAAVYPDNVTACDDAADANDDGSKDSSDAIYIFNWRFLDGPEPPAPGPWACGEDPTDDALDCASYACP